MSHFGTSTNFLSVIHNVLPIVISLNIIKQIV